MKSAARQGTTTERGYGHAWRRLRAQILARDKYLCQISLQKGCFVEATEVDHIVNKATWLRLFGSLDGVDDPSNLQSLCVDEHRKKTQAEAQGDGPGQAGGVVAT